MHSKFWPGHNMEGALDQSMLVKLVCLWWQAVGIGRLGQRPSWADSFLKETFLSSRSEVKTGPCKVLGKIGVFFGSSLSSWLKFVGTSLPGPRLDLFVNSKQSPAQLIEHSQLFKDRRARAWGNRSLHPHVRHTIGNHRHLT